MMAEIHCRVMQRLFILNSRKLPSWVWSRAQAQLIQKPKMLLSRHSCEAMATHSSTLAWKIPWMEGPGRLQSMGSLGVGYDWETSLSLFTFMHWRRKWQPTPVFLPGESQGQGAWWAAVYGVAQSRTRLKRLSSSSSSSRSIMSNSLQPHGLQPTWLLCPWGFSRQEYWSGLPCPLPEDLPNPGTEPRSPSLQADSLQTEPPEKPKNARVGSLPLLQGISPIQESNLGLLHCRRILYQLSYQGGSGNIY